jgi:hypothetical protein
MIDIDQTCSVKTKLKSIVLRRSSSYLSAAYRVLALRVPICSLSRTGIAGSNLQPIAYWHCWFQSARGVDICLLWVLCVVTYKSLLRADHSSRGVLPNVVCLSVVVKPRQWGVPGPLGDIAPKGGGCLYLYSLLKRFCNMHSFRNRKWPPSNKLKKKTLNFFLFLPNQS